MLFKTALLSAMAVLASAYTQPDYNKSPSGNAISKPGLHDLVTTGKPYTIEWEPTTKGPVSLVLLRGPSNNVQPIDTLADSVENSGHFEWTPSTDLEPDTTHYGLLLVVEGSGQYQYSTQFGVKNEKSSTSASFTSAVSSGPPVIQTPVATAAPSSSAAATPAASSTLTSIPVVVPSSSASAVSSSAAVIPSSSAAASSFASASASASGSAPPSLFTGAADRNAVGLGAFAAGVLAALVV